ncbi:hypothetical protein P7J41_05525 [Streptococcus suis]|uniref:hypothetical protein n=1 Tax=Streptococcus suis TaxID=1307 RepID=UPI0038B9CDA9
MFKVINTLTYREWQVETRDQLLAELETASARKNALEPTEEFEIIHLSANGQEVSRILLTLPLEDKIDTLLHGFGHEKKESSIQSFLKRILGGKNAELAHTPITESEYPEAETEQEGDQEPVTATIEDIFEATAEDTAVSAEQLPEDTGEFEEDEVALEEFRSHVEKSESPISSVPEEVTEENLDQSFEEDQVEEVQEQPMEVVQTSSTSTPILKVSSVTDVESLTTVRLQQVYTDQIRSEVAQMNELIARLERQKQGHLALLEHLEQFNPNQALVD